MAQLRFTALLTHGTATIIGAVGADLSGFALPAAFLALSDPAQAAYQVGGVATPAASPSGRWEVYLTAPYAGPSDPAADCRLHSFFTPSLGLPLLEANDTGSRPLLNRANVIVDHLSAKLAPLALGTRTLYASQQGAALDSNLTYGGGTDDHLALQRLCDLADGVNPLHIIVERPALIADSLLIGSYTTLTFLDGAGLYLANGTSKVLVRNRNPSRTTRTDRGIRIRGGLFHGNYANQSGTRKDSQNSWLAAVAFYGVSDVLVEDTRTFDPAAFGFHTVNADHVIYHRCGVNLSAPAFVQDGFHFNGPTEKCFVLNSGGKSGDDLVAFNADDGAHDSLFDTNEYGPYVGEGDIIDCGAHYIHCDGAAFAMRVLSKTKRADQITFSHFSGTCTNQIADFGCYIADTPGANPGNIGTVVVSNCTVESIDPSAYVFVTSGRIENLDIEIQRNNLPAVLVPDQAEAPLLYIQPSSDIQSFTARLRIYDPKENNQEAGSGLMYCEGRIRRLMVDCDWVRDPSIAPKSSVIKVAPGGHIEDLIYRHVAANRIDFITRVDGGIVDRIHAGSVWHKDAPSPRSFLFHGSPSPTSVYIAAYAGPDNGAALVYGPTAATVTLAGGGATSAAISRTVGAYLDAAVNQASGTTKYNVPGMSVSFPAATVDRLCLATFYARHSGTGGGTDGYAACAFYAGTTLIGPGNYAPDGGGTGFQPFVTPDTAPFPPPHLYVHAVSMTVSVPAGATSVKVTSAARLALGTITWHERYLTLQSLS